MIDVLADLIGELHNNIDRSRALLMDKRNRLRALETAIASDVELINHYKRQLLQYERVRGRE